MGWRAEILGFGIVKDEIAGAAALEQPACQERARRDLDGLIRLGGPERRLVLVHRKLVRERGDLRNRHEGHGLTREACEIHDIDERDGGA